MTKEDTIRNCEYKDYLNTKALFQDILGDDVAVINTDEGWHYDAKLYIPHYHKDDEYIRVETKQLNTPYGQYRQWVLNWEKTIPNGTEEKNMPAEMYVEFFSNNKAVVTTIHQIHNMYRELGENKCMWRKNVKKTQVDGNSGITEQLQYFFNVKYAGKYFRVYEFDENKGIWKRIDEDQE